MGTREEKKVARRNPYLVYKKIIVHMLQLREPMPMDHWMTYF